MNKETIINKLKDLGWVYSKTKNYKYLFNDYLFIKEYDGDVIKVAMYDSDDSNIYMQQIFDGGLESWVQIEYKEMILFTQFKQEIDKEDE